MTPTIRLSLPYFQSGQVLKHDDLNNLAAYLEEQDRLTRVMLVGIGIVEGFNFPEVDADAVDSADITIGSGIGISSDGHLFWQDSNRTFTSYFAKDLSTSALMCPPEDGSSANTEIRVLELLMDGQQPPQPTNGTPAPTVNSLSELADGEYVLVLHKEAVTDESSRCFKETETRTANKYYQDKFLLVPRSDYSLCQADAGDEDGDGEQDLRRPWIRRFGYDATAGSILLDNILTFEAFSENYARNCSESFEELEEALTSAYRKYSEILNLSSPNPFSQLTTKLETLLEQYESAADNDVNRLGIQYLYDYQRVLIAAYHEFVECAADLRLGGQMMPDRCLHPRHLALGVVELIDQEIIVDTGECRSIFRSSAFHSENTGKQRKASFLFDRLKALVRIQSAEADGAATDSDPIVLLPQSPSDDTSIRITPSRGSLSELSEHPIPYYLAIRKRQWNFFLKETGQTDGVLGYNLTTNTRPYDKPALYDLSPYSFFRIEGHLGKTAADAYRELRDLRKKMDLPFDFQFVKLGEQLGTTGLQELLAEDLQLIYAAARLDIRCRLEQLLNEGDSHSFDFLPEALIDFDWSEFERKYNAFKESIVSSDTTDIDCRIPTLHNLYEEFRERHYAFHLFHLFADRHPGLEFLSGVPKGGTWVVVYADVPGLGDALVVGDFALPYSCCADRGGAVFPEPYVAASPGHFCHTDGEEYELITYPSGGVLTGTLTGATEDDAALIDEFIRMDSDTGKYYFHPEAVPASAFTAGTAIVQLSYRKYGKTAQGKLLVYQQPTVSFRRQGAPIEQYDDNGKLTGQRITFIVGDDLQPEDATLEWIISGEDTRIVDSGKGEMTADFKYSEGVFYEVILVAKNGSCRTEERMKFTICEESPQVSVEPADGIQFGEDTPVRVTASPRGGVFRLIDPEEHVLSPTLEPTDTDNEYLLPATVFDLAGRYTLVYALPQCLEEDRATIEVRRPPIELTPSSFCSDDETEYPIQLNVPGRFASDQPGVEERGTGQFFFVPATVPTGLYTPDGPALIELQFTTDEGVVATLPVTVFAVPTFVETGRRPLYEETEDGNGTVRCLRTGWTVDFEVEPAIWTEYKWEVAQQPVPAETAAVSFDFRFNQEKVTVGVAVSTDAFSPADCPNSYAAEIDVSCPPVGVRLEGQNGNDPLSIAPGSGSVPLKVDPIGGVFTLQMMVTTNDTGEVVLTDAPSGLTILTSNDRPCAEEATVYNLEVSAAAEDGSYRLTYGLDTCEKGDPIDFIVESPVDLLSGSVAGGGVNSGTGGVESIADSPVMTGRFAQRRDTLDDIRNDPNVPRSNAFRFTEELLEEGLDSATLNDRFVGATSAAAQKVAEASNDQSRDLYQQLLTTGLLYYLDRLVANDPQQIPQSSQDVLEAQLAEIGSELDLSEAATQWDGEAIQQAVEAPAVDQIRNLLPTE